MLSPTAPSAAPSASSTAPSSTTPEDAHNAMDGFLRRRMPYTILPTPLPSGETTPLNDLYFTDSPTQDFVSVMDACLHNLYDVARAKEIFHRLRATSRGEAVLDARVYNALLDAYIRMVSKETDGVGHILWLEDAWALYDDMECEKVKVQPTANTYAIMLQAWHRFGPDSADPINVVVKTYNPAALLRSMINRQIPATLVVSDRAITSSEDASSIITLLSKAAVELDLSKVVNELGMAESLGRQTTDPLDDVPQAKPVMRLKDIQVTHSEDGSVVDIAPGNVQEPEYEVPFNLETLRRHLSQIIFARRVLPEDVAARQKLLEESVYDVAVQRLKHQAEVLDELGLGNKHLHDVDLRTWMWNWHQKLQVRLKAEIANLEVSERGAGEVRRVVGLSPFLSLLKPEKLSLITILELMHLQGSGGVSDGMKTARALLAVGRAVELEHKAEMCKKNNIAVPTVNLHRPDSFFTGLGYRDLYTRRLAASKHSLNSEDWAAEWSQLVRVKIGSFLVDCLMDVATVMRSATDRRTGELVTEEQPAFFHSYEYLRGHKLGVIKLNPVLMDRMAKDTVSETLHPRHLPMLVKPKPWLDYDQGGYLYNKSSVMRFKESQEQQSYLRHASSQGNLELVYAGLDVLGSTPWQINRRIFDVVLQVWNSGERLSKIPPAVYDAPEPKKPENFESDPKARMIYIQRQKAYLHGKANNHSDRCSVNYKIEIARAFLGDTIYFPHNLDFRGRAYPLPPHLSHIGDDLSRGLLKFQEAKPLGERGLRWLKIHLANLYGFDKANFDERVEFVDAHLEDIFDSAEKPLDSRGWWKLADDPWQCLATCMEFKAALDSPNPLEYECALPVHQDGTCNGLQHYAALGGDATGAKQVNLDVTEKPSDVYTHVATMVAQLMQKDLKKGHKYAKMLDGKISRKVVKQTVMTTVYGVTFVGAREQIEKQLKDRGDIPAEECWLAASYIAKKVLASIGNLFKGANEIQSWLNISARLIAKSIPPDRLRSAEGISTAGDVIRRGPRMVSADRLRKEQMTSVVWTTPLGLPIVQPYRSIKRKQIMTALQTVYISDPNVPTAVNAAKQASAFPPNFIHSLDATHMMLTALECRSQSITFASVHDSYWTHAGSIDQMSAIIRETFIALHSSDVLTKLFEEFRERYKGYKVPVIHLRYGRLISKHNLAGTEASDNVANLPGEDAVLTFPGDAKAEAEASGEEVIEVDAEAVANDEEAPKKKKKASTCTTDSVAVAKAAGFTGKFVELVDILPPLPQKGEFDVNTIKNSLYFFS
ncbi:DNA/RNA polymerase [Sparassis latifolia]